MLTILLALATQLAHATAVPGVNRMHFRTFATAEGLSQPTARAMVQDQSGFIWIGTQDGLDRFDGHQFRIFKSDRDDPWSLSQNHIWALAMAGDGRLWVGTQAGGLNRYDPTLDRFEIFRNEPGKPGTLASNHVTALLMDRGGRLWVANSAGQMQWFDEATQTLVGTPAGVQPALRMVRTMLETTDGAVWLGARDGLWRVESDGEGLREIRDEREVSLDVYALAQTTDGDVWVGTGERGLYQFDIRGRLKHRFVEDDEGAASLPDNAVRALLAEADGSLWIAGNRNGLAWLDPVRGQFERYAHDPVNESSVAANRLWSLLRTRSGELLVGSWTKGFSVHHPRTEVFASIVSVPGNPRTLPSPQAMTVWGDGDGTLWVGVLEGGGLIHLDPERGVIARYTHDADKPDSLSHDFVQFITRTRDGSLWVATIGGGLNRMRPGRSGFEHYRHDPNNPASIADDAVYHLYEDSAGTLWVGTANRGLDELCAGCTKFVHHAYDLTRRDSDSSIGGDAVSAITQTQDGSLWLALRSGGLDRYNRASDRFEHFRADRSNPDSISSDAVTTLSVDSRGELWIGTQGGGLSHLVPGSEREPRFETFAREEGLASEAIGAVVEDAQGYLWISTISGISRFERSRRHFLNLGPHDGTLQGGYWINGAARLPEGRIAFSGLEGITLFDPLEVVEVDPPVTVPTRLLLQNVPVKLAWRDPLSPLERSLWLGGQVRLRHFQDNVTVEFTTIEFTNPEMIRYSYRLEGHDSGWIDTLGGRGFATYTNLAPGAYKLRLRSRYDGGRWSDQEAVVDVLVHPSPWASPLALLAYSALAAFVAWLAWLRVRANLHRKAAVQEAIRLSEERLKMSLWGSGGELWDVDLGSGRMHRENMLPNLAVTAEISDARIEAYQAYLHDEDRAGFDRALRAHLHGETPAFETSYRTPDIDGNWVWVITRGRLVERDAEGRPLRMAGTTHDINALKLAEEALRRLNEELESRVDRRTSDLRAANEKLQQTLDRLTLTQRQLLEAEKLASLGALVAGVAHEINTPIGVGVTAASHLEEEAKRSVRLLAEGKLKASDLERFASMAVESSQLILRNMQRADRLVRSFKQVAVDQSNEERRVIELGTYVNEILTTLGPALKKTPHRVSVQCPEPIRVETAPGALYQILSNLVMNSLLHAFGDGRVGSIEIGIGADADQAVIDYRDNGIGMDEVTVARIYDPFFTTKRGVGGSGLGMHIVYNLVTQVLGGSIVVDSAPGRGAHFCIRFGRVVASV